MKLTNLNKKIILIFGILILQGCQNLRLLQCMDQFENPLKYFTFYQDHLIFKEPILKPADIQYLTKSMPSTQTTDGDSLIWQYQLIKSPIITHTNSQTLDNNSHTFQYQLTKSSKISDVDPIHLSFTCEFQHGKLKQLTYPKQISQLFNNYLLQLGLESISKGTYLAKSNTLIPGNPNDYTINKDDLPTKKIVLQHLGVPSEVTKQNHTETLIYNYTVKNNDEIISKPWMSFEFIDGREALTSVSGTIFGPYLQFRFM